MENHKMVYHDDIDSQCLFCSQSNDFMCSMHLDEEHEDILIKMKECITNVEIPFGMVSPICLDCKSNLIELFDIPQNLFLDASFVNIKVEPDLEIYDIDDDEEELDDVGVDYSHFGAQSSRGERLQGVLPVFAHEDERDLEMQIHGNNGEVFVIKSLETGEMKAIDQGRKMNLMKRTPKKRKIHTCPICAKEFIDKTILRIHYRTHTGERPYACNQCEKKFNEKSKLKIHFRTHTGERPYNCPICNKAFVQLCTMKTHMRIHTGETPYVCEHCSRGFTQSYNLTLHLRNVHNVKTVYRGREVGLPKDYICEFCDKIYKTVKSYRIHKRLHTGERPYQCTKCDAGFRYREALRQHLDSHEGIFLCFECGKHLKTKASLKYHMRRHGHTEDFVDDIEVQIV